MNRTKTKEAKRSSDAPQPFCYSSHRDEISASICGNRKWELTHYLKKKTLEANGHSLRYQACVKNADL